jgi:hypothetical protein
VGKTNAHNAFIYNPAATVAIYVAPDGQIFEQCERARLCMNVGITWG